MLSTTAATPRRGRFIVLEAIDLNGKTTQLSSLADALRGRGHSVALTAYPDRDAPLTGALIQRFLHGQLRLVAGSDAEAAVRQMLLGQLLFSLNRRERDTQLRRLLAANDVVLSSRYQRSGRVYAEAGGADPVDLDVFFTSLEADLPRPDLELLIDGDPQLVALRQRSERDAFDTDLDLQQRVRSIYAAQAAADPRFVLIDGSGTPAQVAAAVWSAVARCLPELA